MTTNDEIEFRERASYILMNAGLSPFCLSNTVDGLVKYYSNNRYYHSMSHIIYMLDKMEEAEWDNHDLAFAILFHDVYYVVTAEAGYNEKISADMAGMVAGQCLCLNRKNINDMIMATAEFMVTNQAWLNSPSDELCQKICDLDLSSLAREPYDDFVYQQREILMEHNSVDVSKSAKFLVGLLENRGNSIYYTDHAQKYWLAKAKSNIANLANDFINC